MKCMWLYVISFALQTHVNSSNESVINGSIHSNGLISSVDQCESISILWSTVDNKSDITISNGETFNIDRHEYALLKNTSINKCLSPVKIPVCCDSSHTCLQSVNVTTWYNQSRKDVTIGTSVIKNLTCNDSDILTELPYPVRTNISKEVLELSINSTTVSEFCLTDNRLLACLPEIEPPCIGNCVHKCCPRHQIYDYSLKKCTFTNSSRWSPLFHDTNLNIITDGSQVSHNFSYSFPKCPKFFSIKHKDKLNKEFYLLENASVYVAKYSASYDNTQYCIDHFKKGSSIDEEVLICFTKVTSSSDSECSHIHSNVYPVLLAISVVFLFLTLLVYALLPELNCKLNGRCVMGSTASLMAAYTCLLWNAWDTSISIIPCQILALCTQFFILVSFFWMNVMCYDVWKALRATRFVSGPGVSVNKRFIKFCLYAVGCPFLISFATACVQFIPSDSSKEYLVDPGFGKTGCFFNAKDPIAWWAYYYGIILAVMVVNTLLFVHLLFLLNRNRVNNDAALHRRKRKHVMWLKLYMKLFILMGVTWIFDVISWIEGTCKLWIWIDSINALRGFFIFVIFVCKRSIWKKLWNDNVILSSFRSTTSSKSSKRSQFYTNAKVVETPA